MVRRIGFGLATSIVALGSCTADVVPERADGPLTCAATAPGCAGGAGGPDTEPGGQSGNESGGTGGAPLVSPGESTVDSAPIAGGPPQSTSSGSSRDAGADAAADAAAPLGDRCDVGIHDPARPPAALALTGNLGAHDPVIIAAHGQYWYFSTGNGIAAKTSPDLLIWQQQPEVFADTPAWFTQLVPAYEPRNIWAPDISYFGGQYHLYYSVSSFGSNRSCIGHATRAALNEGTWTDHEDVFCSNQPGQNQNYNAIDPNVIVDDEGEVWLSFGSFWSGIKLIRLDQSGARSGSELYDLASRNGGSIEAPFIVRRCGYYYLFVSFGSCCQGADSTYNIRVGRAPDLLGPYVDRAGVPLMNGGGTLVLDTAGEWVGPGHNAVLFDGPRAYNVYHAYAASNGASRLRIAELVWDAEGWPISGGP